VTEDRLVWKKKIDGEYSVRSAYRMCMQEIFYVSHFKISGSWDIIWRLKMPPRVKNFIWRICRNCIPTRMRIRDKGVNCDTVCSLCNTTEEDTLHLFFHCPNS